VLVTAAGPAGVQNALAAAGTAIADPSATFVPGSIRLFVENGFGDALSLDAPFEHEEPRIWSRREIYAHEYGVDVIGPDGELTRDALEYAWERYIEDADPSRAGTAADINDAGFRAHLDEPDVENQYGEASPMWDEFVWSTSPSAHACAWFEGLRGGLTPERRQQLEEETGFWFRDDTAGRCVHVDPERIEALQARFDELGLLVEIKRI
jgi:hypothetical protein